MATPFVIVQALWLFLPAYLANMTPVFAAKLVPGWKAPIDGGRMGRDGRPFLGPNKTWRGLVSGAVIGALVATLQAVTEIPGWDVSDFAFAEAGILAPILLGLFLGLGAGLGDILKSFLKRRTGRPGGAPWFPFDQLDFVVGGLTMLALAALVLVPATAGYWFADEFVLGDRWLVLLVLVLLTPFLHLLVNWIGFRLKLKAVPW